MNRLKYLLKENISMLSSISLTLLIFIPFTYQTYAKTNSETNLIEKLADPNIDHFEKKKILNSIKDDSVLVKIAIKFDRYDYKDYESYFKYHALLKIKNKNLIYNKADSIEMNLFLFRKYMLNVNDSILKKVINCNPMHSNSAQMRELIDKYIFRNVKNPIYLLRGGLYRNDEISDLFLNQNKPDNNIDYKSILEILESFKNEKSDLGNFLTYIFVNYYDLLLNNNFKDISKYLEYSGNDFFDTSLIKNYNAKNELQGKKESELISLLVNSETNIEDKFFILNNIRRNLITKDLYDQLTNELKMFAILRINDDSVLRDIIISTKEEKIEIIACLRIINRETLIDLLQYFKNKNRSGKDDLVKIIISKLGSNDILTSYYNDYLSILKSYIVQIYPIKDNKLIYDLLKLESDTSKSSGKALMPFSDLLFYLEDQNIIRKIVFGDFNETIKYSILPLISSEKLLTDIIKSDLNINFKLNCINHPFMTNDSLLYELAKKPECNDEMFIKISKKLNMPRL